MFVCNNQYQIFFLLWKKIHKAAPLQYLYIRIVYIHNCQLDSSQIPRFMT